jgi:hypothetical protein
VVDIEFGELAVRRDNFPGRPLLDAVRVTGDGVADEPGVLLLDTGAPAGRLLDVADQVRRDAVDPGDLGGLPAA